MTDIATESPTHGVQITDAAAAKVKSLLAQEGRDDLRLRRGAKLDDGRRQRPYPHRNRRRAVARRARRGRPDAPHGLPT